MEKSSPFLPDDMISEILSRSPVKTLTRLTCLSKFFCKLITCDRRFAYFHLTRSPRHIDVIAVIEEHENSGNLIANLQNTSFSNPLHLSKIAHQLVGSCNGIICFTSAWGWSGTSVYLWNPSLHQIRFLTGFQQTMYSEFLGFGYDPKNQHHKFVRVKSGLSTKVAVYNLEKNSWKLFNHGTPPKKENAHYSRYPHSRKAVEFKGSLNWILDTFHVITFRLSDDKVIEFPLPECDVTCSSLGIVKGCLSVLAIKLDNSSAVWSMTNTNSGDCSWTKIFDFGDGAVQIITYDVELTSSGKIKTRHGLYDPESKTMEPYSESIGYRSQKTCIEYVESLISIYPPVSSS